MCSSEKKKERGYFELFGPTQAKGGSPVYTLLQPSKHEGPADAPAQAQCQLARSPTPPLAQPNASQQGPSSLAHSLVRSPCHARPSLRLNLRSPAPSYLHFEPMSLLACSL